MASEPERVVVRAIPGGTIIGSVALGTFVRERFGAPFWVVHRADLQSVLLDAVRSEASIRILMGRTVEAVVQKRSAVTLTLSTASGQTEPAFDAVVGADGVWSDMRRALGDEKPATFRGSVAWRATIPRDHAPAGLAGNETGLWLGRSGHVVHYPIAGGRLLNVVAIERRDEPVEGWSTPGTAPPSRPASTTRLRSCATCSRSRRAGFCGPSTITRPGGSPRAASRSSATPDTRCRSLAQGAALAIEDAAVLAQALARDPNDPAKALTAYQRERLGRVRRVQRQARRNGRIYHAGRVVSLARNLTIRRLGLAAWFSAMLGFTVTANPEPDGDLRSPPLPANRRCERTWRNR